jgi:hypothetical protein
MHPLLDNDNETKNAVSYTPAARQRQRNKKYFVAMHPLLDNYKEMSNKTTVVAHSNTGIVGKCVLCVTRDDTFISRTSLKFQKVFCRC